MLSEHVDAVIFAAKIVAAHHACGHLLPTRF